MSDEHPVETIAQMAAILCGRGGGQGAKARRRAARRAWSLYAEVHRLRFNGLESVRTADAEASAPELVGSEA